MERFPAGIAGGKPNIGRLSLAEQFQGKPALGNGHVRIGSAKAENYLIRVNRQPCASDHVLQPLDHISITPTKIEGAADT